jgi:NAD(P)-dependent dehydrogenase (short-subunit alcohol dehydrogenase family)
MRLKDKVAVLTGGGGGLGEGIALCLARQGARVVVSDMKQDLAEKVADTVKEKGGQAIAVKTDVRVAADCEALMKLAAEKMGRIDILVCGAGVSGLSLRPDSDEPLWLENFSEDEWDFTIDVNLKGVFLCNRAVVPYFKRQKSGKIVNISSIGGRKGMEFIPPHYGASKAGVIVFSQAVASQLAAYNVNVNTICPGIIWTPMWQEVARILSMSYPAFKGLPPDKLFGAVVEATIPMKRPQMPEDIGNAVVFLVSEEAREITGQALNVDGGTIFS